MRETDINKLTILLRDINQNDDSLFKAISSIIMQVGINLSEQVHIMILSKQSTINLDKINQFFPDLALTLLNDNQLTDAQLLNLGLNEVDTNWVTIVDSRDLLFSDGALLDFFNNITTNKNLEMLTFKYVYRVEDQKTGLSKFDRADFLNVPYGKYFNIHFLKANQIIFNEKLNQYLLEDFTSRAMNLCRYPLWVDLNNYYLSTHEEDNLSANFNEFVIYRLDFLNFMKKHKIAEDIYLRDAIWSIVMAWAMMVQINETQNDEYLLQLGKLFKLINYIADYETLLEKECQNQGVTTQIPYQQLAILMR